MRLSLCYNLLIVSILPPPTHQYACASSLFCITAAAGILSDFYFRHRHKVYGVVLILYLIINTYLK